MTTKADIMNPDRRQLLGTAAMGTVVASMANLLVPNTAQAATASDAIRPFRVNVPEEDQIGRAHV